jgi:hypothetical protein
MISTPIAFSGTRAPSKGWRVQWELVPPGQKSEPCNLDRIVEETKRMKPIDKAIFWMVSESRGRNVSEPTGGLERK